MGTFGRVVRAGLLLAAVSIASAQAGIPEYNAVVVKTYPHDPGAFTEGLLYQDGYLYESTGLNGRSSIRKVQLETGEVVQRRDLDSRYFGEGIVIWKNHLIALTYTTHIGFIFDVDGFKPVSDFHYDGEGWALTRDSTRVFMSDGTDALRILDPDSLRETGRIHVTCDGHPVHSINELEWVNGEIFANIWRSNIIVRIAPATGAIVGWIDLNAIAASAGAGRKVDVLNGIAYDPGADRLFVTGKLWPTLYQIKLAPRPFTEALCPTLP